MRTADENKKLAIAEATIELVVTAGFSETSLSKIAKKAGVATASIYTYFKNKDRFLGQNTFPFQYLGVEIPVTFLKEFISLYYSFKSSDRFYPLVSAYFAYEKALKWKLY